VMFKNRMLWGMYGSKRVKERRISRNFIISPLRYYYGGVKIMKMNHRDIGYTYERSEMNVNNNWKI
jgi:hypothetical protein